MLGPLRVVTAGRAVSIGSGRQRAVLAVLLLSANRTVSADRVIDAVWGEHPASSAQSLVRTYIWRLRALLTEDGQPRLLTEPAGYLLRVEPGELDRAEFERLLGDGRTALARDDSSAAGECLRGALNLWRGEPFSDVTLHDGDLAVEILRLSEARIAALEERIEADLALGRHEDLIGELQQLTASHPLRERITGQLMLACYRAGRQGDALAAYGRIRTALTEELGMDSGRELQRLHERILRADPGLLTGGPARRVGERIVPRQLPAAPGHFAGRAEELKALTGVLGHSGQAGGTVVISAIDGMAGVGKTALAVHAAHRLAERFGDGQLFIDLHGYTQGYQARTAADALEQFLRALGVPPQRIPQDIEERAAVYRQRLAGTRTLIVLDNAAGEAQVRPLLPGAAGCMVLVTSRRRLKALDDAVALPLDVLSPADAIALLRTVAGPDRVPGDDPVLPEVAELCGRLPLALRIAATLIRHRPAWSLAHLAGKLREIQPGLGVFFDGDRSLTAVFDLSYHALTGHQQLLFRHMGLIPGPDIDAYAAAALIDTDRADAERLLQNLVDHNLLAESAAGRYQMHDLIRLYAHSQADHDPAQLREGAVGRLLDYYQHTAARADTLITRRPRPEPPGPVPAHAPTLPDPDQARAWLRTERANLLACLQHATAHAQHARAVTLTAGLASLLRTDGPWPLAITLHTAAIAAAEHLHDQHANADALTDLGDIRRLTGDFPGAVRDLQAALDILRETGDRRGHAGALTELGIARSLTGDHLGAACDLGAALEIFREIGDRRGHATALTELGEVRTMTGDYPGAACDLQSALEISREIGDRRGHATALTRLAEVRAMTGDLSGATHDLQTAVEVFREIGARNAQATAQLRLGAIRRATGDLSGATRDLEQSADLSREVGDRNGQAIALAELGLLRLATRDLSGAAHDLQRALEVFREIGARGNQAWALNQYAAVVAATGDHTNAQALYRDALHLAHETQQPDEQAPALEGIGECHLHAGDTDSGVQHLTQALEIFQRLAMRPDTERVQARLADIAQLRLTPGSRGT